MVNYFLSVRLELKPIFAHIPSVFPHTKILMNIPHMKNGRMAFIEVLLGIFIVFTAANKHPVVIMQRIAKNIADALILALSLISLQLYTFSPE